MASLMMRLKIVYYKQLISKLFISKRSQIKMTSKYVAMATSKDQRYSLPAF